MTGFSHRVRNDREGKMTLAELKNELKNFNSIFDRDFVRDSKGRHVGNCLILPALKKGKPKKNVLLIGFTEGLKTNNKEFREFIHNISNENDNLEVVDSELNPINDIVIGAIYTGGGGREQCTLIWDNKKKYPHYRDVVKNNFTTQGL
jgi:hypothetical protein